MERMFGDGGIPWKRRLGYASIAMVALVTILGVGALAELGPEQAERIADEAERLVAKNLTPLAILSNNLAASMLMTIPVVGLLLAPVIVYNTGLVFAAVSSTQQVPAWLLLLTPFVTIYGLFEMLGYGFAVSEGVLFVRQIFRKRLRAELRVLPLVIAITVGMLAFAAVIEFAIIAMFSP